MSASLSGPVLITGGAGFIGSNLADALATAGHDVIVFDALARPGVERNLAWLTERHGPRIAARVADVRDADALREVAAEARAVFHLAAQVAVTTSLVDPAEDFDINVRGAFNLLEALRRKGRRTPLVFASTNKVYGDLAELDMELIGEAYTPSDESVRKNGVSERWPLDFHTPYGCSKGAADQYVLDYARSFDLPTCVLRMSCIYGPRQMGTEDQGWVAHFLIRALAGAPITLYGDGRQVRDILHVNDAVKAYLAAWSRIERVKGRAFNLGGGSKNAVSLRQLLGYVETLLGKALDVTLSDWRAGDQRYFVSDTRLIRETFELPDAMDWRAGVADLLRWLREEAPEVTVTRVPQAAGATR